MLNRWRLIAAVTGSLLFHAVLLFGCTASRMPSGPLVDGRRSIRAHFIVSVANTIPAAEAAVPAVPPVLESALKAAPKAVVRRPAAAAPSEQPPAVKQAAVTPATKVPPLPAAPSYREGPTLDPPPRPLDEINPEYPDAAGLREGSVVLRLLISAAGVVDDVAVVSANPEGLFEASALAAFGRARFAPGLYLGVPVPSQITIEVQYTPVDRGNAVSGQSGLGIGR